MFPSPLEKSSRTVQILYRIALPLALCVWLVPLFSIALTSVRPAVDITMGNYWGWPSSFNMFQNYSALFTTSPIGNYLLNSFKVTVPTVIGTVLLSSMTGYALAVYKFRSNLPVLFMFVAGNFVPYQILMVPVRDFSLAMGMYNTTHGLVLFHIAFQTGFCTLFMRNFIRALPHELIEAARVEGVSEFQIYWHLVLPLVRPALAALGVLVFTFIWNDYFWATVMTSGTETQPITAGLYSLNGSWVSAWHLVSAGSIVAALPPVIIFFMLQKHFIAGLTLGSVK